jgi:hypothetical protein
MNLRTNFDLYLIRPFLADNLANRHLAKLLLNEDAENIIEILCHKKCEASNHNIHC